MSRQDRHEHERALELAVGAIDYRLTPAQTVALDAHLAACPACARSAAAMRGDAIALRPRTTTLPSRRVDDAVSAAIAGRRATSPSLLVLVAAALLLVALLGVASVAGSLLLRTWWTPPTVEVAPSPFVVADASPTPAGPTDSLADARFDAVFVRPSADGDATAASTIWAVGADGTERLLASVPIGAADVTVFAPGTALSDAGHLALQMRDGDRVGWAILDVTNPSAKPIPVALPGREASNPSFGVWGPGERLAIILSAYADGQAIAFVDPMTGAATVQPLSNMQYGCWTDRCGVWAADGSGVVMYGTDLPSGLVIVGSDGKVAPFGSRVWPNSIGTRDVNEAGDLLLGGRRPLDDPPFDNELLYVRAPGEDDRLVLRLPGELPDRAWAADGRDVWLLNAQWLAASRPVTLERFSPPSQRTAIASFVAAVDFPSKNVYVPAATFAGIAPDDSLAVVEIAATSSDPLVFQGKLVDLRSGASVDVDGSFVGWLASEE